MSFSNQADELLADVVRSQSQSTVKLVERAVRQGAAVKLFYFPSTGIVSIDLVHRSGSSNVLYSAQVNASADADDDEEDDGFGLSSLDLCGGSRSW